MDGGSGAAGLAALSVCESILLSLTENEIIDDAEARAILPGAGAPPPAANPRGRARRPRRGPPAGRRRRRRPRGCGRAHRAGPPGRQLGAARLALGGEDGRHRRGRARTGSTLAVRWTPRSMSEVVAYRGEAFLAGYAESLGVPVHEAGHRFE